MFPTTLHALEVVTLCKLYWWRFFSMFCRIYWLQRYNLVCMVVRGGGSGAGGGGGGGGCTGGCCPCSSGTYSY